jgi:hypothetical protein
VTFGQLVAAVDIDGKAVDVTSRSDYDERKKTGIGGCRTSHGAHSFFASAGFAEAPVCDQHDQASLRK